MVKGVLPIALRAHEEGNVGILVPPGNATAAGVVGCEQELAQAAGAVRNVTIAERLG